MTTSEDDQTVRNLQRVVGVSGPKGPHSGSLTRRILAFYEANPHEWLTYDDMAVKFDCTFKQARFACAALRRDGRAAFEAMHIVRMVPAPGDAPKAARGEARKEPA